MIRKTSQEAFETRDGTNPQKVLNLLETPHYCMVGLQGITCDEAQVILGLSHQTCSPCFTALSNKELIKDSGQRRKTRSGRNSIVWIKSSPSTFWTENQTSVSENRKAVINAACAARMGAGWTVFDIAIAKLRRLEKR